MTKAYGFSAYGGPETQDWFDLPDPTPGPSEVLIRVRAAGVNAVDHKIRGGWGADPNADAVFPRVLGVEGAGVVEAVGQDVDHVKVGDEVFGRAATGSGTYAELAVLDGPSTTKKPAQVGFDAVVGIPVSALTAWAALDQLGLGEGDTLLLNAAGGSVGVVLLQLARDRGIAAFGIASESKRPMVESLGGVLVPYDGGTDVVTAVRELIPGGVDGIVDLVGGDALQQIAVLVKNPARILSGVDPAAEGLGGAMITQDRPAAWLGALAELVAEGKLDLKVTDTYPFDEAPQALASVESGHSLGKVVIDLTQTTQT